MRVSRTVAMAEGTGRVIELPIMEVAEVDELATLNGKPAMRSRQRHRSGAWKYQNAECGSGSQTHGDDLSPSPPRCLLRYFSFCLSSSVWSREPLGSSGKVILAYSTSRILYKQDRERLVFCSSPGFCLLIQAGPVC